MSLGHLFVQGDLLVWWWYGRDRADKLAMFEDPKLEQPEVDTTVLSEHIKKKKSERKYIKLGQDILTSLLDNFFPLFFYEIVLTLFLNIRTLMTIYRLDCV